RPARTITNPSQRIDVVRARRDQTLEDIATEKGVSATALMWANGIGDPQTALPAGIAIKVPPKGTMLHRVKETDTLEGIARAYRVRVGDVTSYPGNNVQQSSDLVVGTYLLIPTENLPVRDHTVFYQVRPGDSLWKITQSYGLTKPTTVVWANNLPENWILKPGQVIAIPPTDGVIHVVEDMDTQRNIDDATTQIAKNFACAAIPCNDPPTDLRVGQLRDAIFAFGPNGLTHGGRLVKGQEILVPNGIPYVEPPPVVIPPAPIIDNPAPIAPAAPVSGAPRSVRAVAPAQAPAPASGFPGQYSSNYYPAQSYSCSGRNPSFVWPEGGTITSNYTSYHNGIDIAAVSNTPLVAVQAGWVVYAGWTSSGLGYAVYVDHGNGFVTVYGHMWSVAVSVGQRVSRGQYLGPEGSTGNSTGPHIHFMVIDNGRSCNPFNYLP
ncbi:MAG: peptidoglycan DD-metalloendopeptidase family protein, partial [Thermomicrobiales bacterium]